MLWQYILNVPEHDANIEKGNIRIYRILSNAYVYFRYLYL